MKKTVFVGIILLSLLLAGCGGPTDVDTGVGEKQVEAEKSDSKSEKRFKADKSTEVLGVKVNIAEVVIESDRIEVGMNLENTNSDQVTWFPDQDGKAIVGDKQLNANMFMGDSIGGEIAGGVKQNGVLVFLANDKDKIDPKSVKEIKLDLGEITTHDYMKSKKVQFTLKVGE